MVTYKDASQVVRKKIAKPPLQILTCYASLDGPNF